MDACESPMQSEPRMGRVGVVGQQTFGWVVPIVGVRLRFRLRFQIQSVRSLSCGEVPFAGRPEAPPVSVTVSGIQQFSKAAADSFDSSAAADSLEMTVGGNLKISHQQILLT
jgi:hypothetical protein